MCGSCSPHSTQHSVMFLSPLLFVLPPSLSSPLFSSTYSRQSGHQEAPIHLIWTRGALSVVLASEAATAARAQVRRASLSMWLLGYPIGWTGCAAASVQQLGTSRQTYFVNSAGMSTSSICRPLTTPALVAAAAVSSNLGVWRRVEPCALRGHAFARLDAPQRSSGATESA